MILLKLTFLDHMKPSQQLQLSVFLNAVLRDGDIMIKGTLHCFKHDYCFIQPVTAGAESRRAS